MQVRTGRVSSTSFITDDGPLADTRSLGDRPAGEMAVQRVEAVGVHDDHVAAIPTQTTRVATGLSEVVDHAAVGGVHRRAQVSGDVDAGVEMSGLAVGIIGFEVVG